MRFLKLTAMAVVLAIELNACAGRFTFPKAETAQPWVAVRSDCAGWAYSGEGSGRAELIWRTKAKTKLIASPVAEDGIIFIPAPNRRVLALDARTGRRLGRLWVDVLPSGGLALGEGMLALTGSSDFNRLRIFDYYKGDFLWDKKSERAFSAPIICGEKLFHTTVKGAVFAIDVKTGEKIWRAEIPNAVLEHEPAFRDSLLYIADSNKRLVAISADSGTVRWTLELASSPSGQPLVIPDHVIVPTANGRIYVILLNGSIRLTIDAPGEMISGLACSGPTVFGVTKKGIAFAGDLGQGGILWQTNLNTPVIAPPVLWGRQLAVVTAEGVLKLIYFADGAVEHTIDLSTPVTAAPIIYDNTLFIATEEGEIIAISRDKKAD